MRLVTCLCLLLSLPALADRFPLAGHYYEESTGMHITIDDNRKIAISNVSWEYPNPLMSQGTNSYRSTGYYPSGGCQVPVKTNIDFDDVDKMLFVEFHHPTMIISGLFGCQFPGDRVEFHTLRANENVTQDWQRFMEGYGCGKHKAKADLDRQIKKYTEQCTAQQGKSSTKLKPQPSCWAPDPNDMFCQYGECWWRGEFFCDLARTYRR